MFSSIGLEDAHPRTRPHCRGQQHRLPTSLGAGGSADLLTCWWSLSSFALFIVVVLFIGGFAFFIVAMLVDHGALRGVASFRLLLTSSAASYSFIAGCSRWLAQAYFILYFMLVFMAQTIFVSVFMAHSRSARRMSTVATSTSTSSSCPGRGGTFHIFGM
jgi:membrane-bound ClpP family serine protease